MLLGPCLSSSTDLALGKPVEKNQTLLRFRHIPVFWTQDTASCQGQGKCLDPREQVVPKGHDGQSFSLHQDPVLAAGPASLSSCRQGSRASPGHGKWPRQQMLGIKPILALLPAFKTGFLGKDSLSSNFPTFPTVISPLFQMCQYQQAGLSYSIYIENILVS